MDTFDDELEELEPRARRPFAKLVIGLLVLVGLVIVWRVTPLGEYADPTVLRRLASPYAARWWASSAAVGSIALLGMLAFPMSALMMVSGLIFGTLNGALIAFAGAFAAAQGSFGIGRLLDPGTLDRFGWKRIARARQWLVDSGMWPIVAVRIFPVAPYAIINVVAGSSGLSWRDYTFGTLVGLVPGAVLMAFVGDQLGAAMSGSDMVGVMLAVGGCGVLVAGAYFLARRRSDE